MRHPIVNTTIQFFSKLGQIVFIIVLRIVYTTLFPVKVLRILIELILSFGGSVAFFHSQVLSLRDDLFVTETFIFPRPIFNIVLVVLNRGLVVLKQGLFRDAIHFESLFRVKVDPSQLQKLKEFLPVAHHDHVHTAFLGVVEAQHHFGVGLVLGVLADDNVVEELNVYI